MQIRLSIITLMLVTAFAVSAAEVDMSQCAFPAPPEVPDGASATEEQMAGAASAVRAYVGETQTALECLGELETALGEEITADQRTSIVDNYNAHVDEMNAVASEYNQQVRVFKGNE